MKSWIEISGERLRANYRVLVEAVGAETDVMAVVKANAYGHGAEECSVELVRAGARWLGVADVQEGVALRRALTAAGVAGGDAPRVLVMCGLMPGDAAAFAEHDLTPVVWTAEQVEWLTGSGVRAHVEIETGMGRQGVKPGADLEKVLDAMSAAGLKLDGVLTHFCAAEVADGTLTRAQRERFEQAIAQVRQRGLRPAWVHAGSSSTVDNPPQGQGWLVEQANSIGARAMVRCGIALYGYCNPIEQAADGCGPSAERSSVVPQIRAKLKPVMTWKTRVLDVREVAPGETVGYNATFAAKKPMRLALLPVGYSDGLRRSLSSTDARPGGWVRIAARDGTMNRAAIVGRVSMNLTMVDVTEIEGVRVGDEVVLLGDGVTADDHAALAGTIAYEILCGVRAASSAGASRSARQCS